jgi:hypothetical protein
MYPRLTECEEPRAADWDLPRCLYRQLCSGVLCFCLIYFVLVLPAQAIDERPFTGKVAVDTLLSNPANIAECIVKITGYDENGKPQANPLYALLRWQANGCYYRSAPTREELSSTNAKVGFEAFGRFEDNAWLIDPHYGTNVVFLISTSQKDQAVLHSVQRHLFLRGSLILNFGLFDCFPGTVHFNGDSMVQFTNAGGTEMYGSVDRNQDGSVRSLRFTVSFGTHAIPWRIDYTYFRTAALPQGFPSDLDGYTVDDPSNPKRHYHISYLSAILRSSELAAEAFNAPSENNSTMHIVQTNGLGVLVRAPFVTPLAPGPNGIPFARPVVLLFFVLSCVILAVPLLRKTAATNNKQQKEQA